MILGKYLLAKHTIRISSLYEEIQLMCTAYSSNQDPEFTVTITEEDIRYEELKDKVVRIEEDGFYVHKPADAYLETIAVQRKLSTWLLSQNVLLFHASAIAVDGKCYLFTAKSGTGKSTHTRLWRELLGDRAIMVNDDKPFLGVTPEGIMVFGSPWDGKHHLSTNTAVPLHGICIVTRGEQNQITSITGKEALHTLMEQSFMPEDPFLRLRVLDMINEICKQIPLYRMACNMELDAARMSYEMMTKEQNIVKKS